MHLSRQNLSGSESYLTQTEPAVSHMQQTSSLLNEVGYAGDDNDQADSLLINDLSGIVLAFSSNMRLPGCRRNSSVCFKSGAT